jgi:hypothetical protein
MTIRVITPTPRSAVVRPSTTATRDMGSDRNRSITPLPRSFAIPIVVKKTLNATVWAKIPAIRNSR